MKKNKHPFMENVGTEDEYFSKEYLDFLEQYDVVLKFISKAQLERDIKEYRETQDLIDLVNSQFDGDDYIGFRD